MADDIALKRSKESVIWDALVTSPEQEQVTLTQIIKVLQKLMRGLMKPEQVEMMVIGFAQNHGLVSELELMNKKEFKELIDRIVSDWISDVDKNGDGLISRKEFYDNLYSVYGWQAWLAKKSINKTFENAVKYGDENGDSLISKEEKDAALFYLLSGVEGWTVIGFPEHHAVKPIKELLRKFALGEAKMEDVICIPGIAKLML